MPILRPIEPAKLRESGRATRRQNAAPRVTVLSSLRRRRNFCNDPTSPFPLATGTLLAFQRINRPASGRQCRTWQHTAFYGTSIGEADFAAKRRDRNGSANGLTGWVRPPRYCDYLVRRRIRIPVGGPLTGSPRPLRDGQNRPSPAACEGASVEKGRTAPISAPRNRARRMMRFGRLANADEFCVRIATRTGAASQRTASRPRCPFAK